MNGASGGHHLAATQPDRLATHGRPSGTGAGDAEPRACGDRHESPSGGTADRNARLSCDEFHRITRALADPQRFALLQKLSGSRETACQQLVEAFPVTQATISHHLKELHAAGLITCRRDGKCVHLRADRDRLRAYQRELAQRLGAPARRRTVAKGD